MDLQNKDNGNTEEVNNWDGLTIWLLVIAALILLFSFFAPALFVSKAITPEVDFSKTGPIGDTIGGIMNPFIALVGILLTFLAFYMQIKANQIQKQLFLNGLKAEKEKDNELERKDALYKLSLLKVDLETIKIDINEKASKIKDFYESEKSKPFQTNLLFRTPSNKYTRILDLDRLSIYKGFKLVLSSDETWLKSFNRLYSSLDYLPLFFEEVYSIYENHSKKKFKNKTEVTTLLLEFNNLGSELLTEYKIEKKDEDYLNFPASNCVNNAMSSYYEIIQKNYDAQGNFQSETNLDEFNKDMLLPFIENVLAQREEPSTFDRRLEPIGQLASDIRKKIHLIKQESIWFSVNVEKQYNDLMIDRDDFKSTNTVIREIHEFISDGLKEQR
tara:strand:- start:1292 stop:2452 length:1161 start_codon:yes stop_codon:yes gene_type:complete